MRMFHVDNLYSDDKVSYALIDIDGINPNGMVINTGCDSTYEVVGGQALFAINGLVSLVKEGESVTVSRGARYCDWGRQALMLVTSTPPFDPKKVI